jgi:hypothetical protein
LQIFVRHHHLLTGHLLPVVENCPALAKVSCSWEGSRRSLCRKADVFAFHSPILLYLNQLCQQLHRRRRYCRNGLSPMFGDGPLTLRAAFLRPPAIKMQACRRIQFLMTTICGKMGRSGNWVSFYQRAISPNYYHFLHEEADAKT